MSEVISSKRIKHTPALLTIIVDGVNLMNHPLEPRLLLKTDHLEIQNLDVNPETLTSEELYKILCFLQGTSLNLSGRQKVLLRTIDNKLIGIDPRLKPPPTFTQFLDMMHRFSEDDLVYNVDGNTILMKYVKSDLEQSLPPGAPRYCVFIGNETPVDPKTFIDGNPIAVYVSIDPKKISSDELLLKKFCLSNDKLTTESTIWRVIKAVESKANIW